MGKKHGIKRKTKQRLWSLGSAMGTAMVNFALWPAWPVIVGLAVIMAHEWGHWAAAQATGGSADWPLYIPLGLVVIGLTRIRSVPPESKGLVYLAGPLAGAVAALMALGVAVVFELGVAMAVMCLGFEIFSATAGSDGRKYQHWKKEYACKSC